MITMENKQRVKTIAVIFIIAIVLISLITEFLYIFNNKYTYNKLQPEKGVLTLSQEEIDSNPFHFLGNFTKTHFSLRHILKIKLHFRI